MLCSEPQILSVSEARPHTPAKHWPSEGGVLISVLSKGHRLPSP